MEVVNNGYSSEEEELIIRIEEEMRKIYLSVEKLYNNASLFETTDPLEKCFITNYSYSSCLLDQPVTEDDIDILKSFEESLKIELDCLASDMDKLVRKVNEHKEQFDWISGNIANLKQMMESQKKEKKTDKKMMDVILKNLKLRFKKEKSDLKAIVSSLFPENLDTQDLIARIVDHHFSEGAEKYLRLEEGDSIIEQIELLRRTRLFETSPHDPLQIRLADVL